MKRFASPFLALLLAGFIAPAWALTPAERGLVQEIDLSLAKPGLELLAETVKINSGTMNPEGIRAVAELYEARLRALGFKTSKPELAKAGRSIHLIGEHPGKGKRFLLIGHMDTVFEKDSGFLDYKDLGDGRISGPGVSDMKGGNVVLLEALEALSRAGELKDMNVTVFLTGDEESPGVDADGSTDTTRGALVEFAKHSDVALCFEPTHGETPDPIATRRGYTPWSLAVTAKGGHSSLIFSPKMGPGAIYPLSRILDRFYGQLRHEKFLTFNVGNLSGGTSVTREKGLEDVSAKVAGKRNIIPARAEVFGDLRFIDAAQLERVREKMRGIVERELRALNHEYAAEAQVSARIEFGSGYPAMSPRPGNLKLVNELSRVSEELGYGKLHANDPMSQGAGDISFAAPWVPAALDGLGPRGFDYHTPRETTELASVTIAAKRATLLIHRLRDL